MDDVGARLMTDQPTELVEVCHRALAALAALGRWFPRFPSAPTQHLEEMRDALAVAFSELDDNQLVDVGDTIDPLTRALEEAEWDRGV